MDLRQGVVLVVGRRRVKHTRHHMRNRQAICYLDVGGHVLTLSSHYLLMPAFVVFNVESIPETKMRLWFHIAYCNSEK